MSAGTLRTGEAALLGAVQGLTEFLPVSSSAHLALVRRLGRVPHPPRSFDVLLHLATMAALIPATHRTVVAPGIALMHDLARHGTGVGRYSAEGRHALNLVLATVPSVLAGGILHRPLERWSRRRDAPVIGLLVGAALLALGEWLVRRASVSTDRDGLSAGTALLIGIAQAAALSPGVSRSGATIGAAEVLGFDRARAVQLSFELAVPVTLAAALRTLPDLVRERSGPPAPQMAVAMSSAFVSGLAGALVLRRLVTNTGLAPFVAYRGALAGILWALDRRRAGPASARVVHSIPGSIQESTTVS